MKKFEQAFTAKLQKWLYHNFKVSCLIEVKVVDKGNFQYKNWLKKHPHQFRNLQICGRHFIHKWSDVSRLGTPVDICSLAGCAGYLIINWRYPKNKEFFIIEISDIKYEIDNGVITLTEDRAREIAYKIGTLK